MYLFYITVTLDNDYILVSMKSMLYSFKTVKTYINRNWHSNDIHVSL